jgi:predicted nucleotidyltransferase
MKLTEHLERIVRKKVDLLTPSGLKSIRNSRIRHDIEQSIDMSKREIRGILEDENG